MAGDARTPQPESTPPPGRTNRGGRRTCWIVAGMVLLWVVVILSRSTIRAHWWVHRLQTTDSADARLVYFYRLASLGDRAVPAVSRLLNAKDAGLRSFAVGVLHHAPGDDAFTLLVRVCRDTDPDVARIALQGLGLRGDERCVEELASIATGDEECRAMMAVASLSRTDSDAAKCVLIDLVRTSPHVGVRVEAIEGLEAIRTREAIGVLIEALQDDAVFEGVTEGDLAAARVFEAAGVDPRQRFDHPERASLRIDDRHVVWRRAARALRTITGHSCAFSDEETADRAAVAEAWRRWWRSVGTRDSVLPP